MKASELIDKLQSIIKEHGDIQIVHWNEWKYDPISYVGIFEKSPCPIFDSDKWFEDDLLREVDYSMDNETKLIALE